MRHAHEPWTADQGAHGRASHWRPGFTGPRRQAFRRAARAPGHQPACRLAAARTRYRRLTVLELAGYAVLLTVGAGLIIGGGVSNVVGLAIKS